MLLTKVQSLLNTTHMKYVSLFRIDQIFEPKLVLSNTLVANNEEEVVSKIEFELQFEREATERWMNFQSIKEFSSLDQLVSYSTVCDLLLIENIEAFQKYGVENVQQIIDRVHCPVAILPDQLAYNELVIINDNSLNIIALTKSFLNLFTPDLRNLPLSVFVDGPESEVHINNERAFINYLKLYFKNIGIQLLDDEPVVCIKEFMHKEKVNPFVLMSSDCIAGFKEQGFFKSGPIGNLIAFVIKSGEE